MSLRLKRTVLFFCVFYLGLVGCLGNTAIAETNKIFLGGILKEYGRLRVVSGTVTCNGSGLEGVEIYDGNKRLGNTNSKGFYSVQITQGLPTTLTPVKTGYQFNPPSIVIPADQYDHPDRNFEANGACPPGVATLISPKGTIYTSMPKFEWAGPINATYYIMRVLKKDGLPVFTNLLSHVQAGCASGSGNCSVTSNTSLPDGSYFWDVKSCLSSDQSTCGEFSSEMDFIVSAGPKDPMVGLWDLGDGGQARAEERTSGTYGETYKFVATVTQVGTWWNSRGITLGEEVWWVNKEADGHYRGMVLVKGNFYPIVPFDVVIQGNQMIDNTGKLIATKVQ